jgi:hypothetical protein
MFLSGKIEPRIAIIVRNDRDDPAVVTTVGTFVDGKPYQIAHETVLPHRGEMQIQLSNVGNAALLEAENNALLFTLAAETAP